MSRYEVLMLAVPEITQDEATSLETHFQGAIKKSNASVISFERWGKYRLAYPVSKNDYGVYFLARFEVESKPALVLEGIKSLLAVDQRGVVMRYTIKALGEGSLEYKRPASLEETPPKEATSFGRGRSEGRGGRSGFSRGPRGPRPEGSFSRRQEYSRPVENEDELEAMQDMINEEVQ